MKENLIKSLKITTILALIYFIFILSKKGISIAIGSTTELYIVVTPIIFIFYSIKQFLETRDKLNDIVIKSLKITTALAIAFFSININKGFIPAFGAFAGAYMIFLPILLIFFSIKQLLNKKEAE